MPLGYAELEDFYGRLVKRAHSRKIPCAITSGMACVAFGVSQTTQDCDLLCAPDSAAEFLHILNDTSLRGRLPSYRGHISPPLDKRWLRGGWTSHFVWKPAEGEAYIDVFGIAPRASSAWQTEVEGLYACRRIVAEMKHTNRERDWPSVTALGAQMIEAGDTSGWLHIFDAELLRALTRTAHPPRNLVKRRPVLELAVGGDPRLRLALHAEIQYWHELDRARLGIYQRAVRIYVRAVKKASMPDAPLLVQHGIRVRCAELHLPENPLLDYGLNRMIDEAREAVAGLVNPAGLAWLPDVREHFRFA